MGAELSRAPRLMLVTDARRARLPLLDLAMEAVAGGADAIYLRDVDLPADDLAILVSDLRDRVGASVALLIKGDPETARALGIGLQLRECDMTPTEARVLLDPNVLIGKSVHAADGATRAAGANYLLAGHVYASASKPGRPPLGLAGFAAIVEAAPCPVLAIGGITAARVTEVVAVGAAGVAVIGAIAEAADPRAAAAALLAALDDAHQHRTKESAVDETPGARGAAPTVEIVVNGKAATVPTAASVHDFLVSKRMTDAMAIVERNGAIVPRAEYGSTELVNGDRLEVVHAVGGG